MNKIAKGDYRGRQNRQEMNEPQLDRAGAACDSCREVYANFRSQWTALLAKLVSEGSILILTKPD